jgi:flagellar hook-associated protein 1 FlgK
VALSTFLGVETALRGLVAQQRALDTTGHNIANANTVGYTREEATFVETPPITEVPNYGQVGTGVTVQGYQRMRDAILDAQVRGQTMIQSYQDARSGVLQRVEQTLNEPSDSGVQSQLDAFWSSWQDLANSPENAATRQALLQSAGSLASSIQSLRGQLSTIDSTTQKSMG